MRLWHSGGAIFRRSMLGVPALGIAMMFPTAASALTFTVNSTAAGPDANTADAVCQTANPGECTLRAAVEQADAPSAPGHDLINFANTVSGTINMTTTLTITDPVTIDGSTAQGASHGQPTVRLDGAAAAAGTIGILINNSGGGSVIGDLIITRYPTDAFNLSNSNGNTLQGNIVGTDLNGASGLANGGNGISVGPPASGSDNTLIGGTGNGQGNVIAGALNGIAISQSSNGNVVEGNKVGTNPAGTSALGNATGIFVNDTGNTIGGSAPGSGNLISGNTFGGIGVFAPQNQIAGNLIGTNATASGAVANGQDGVHVVGSGGGTAGTTISGNVISGNGSSGLYPGVSITGGTGPASVTGNSIGVASGGLPVPNSGEGLSLGGASGVQVGTPAAPNLIAFNNGVGVSLSGASTADPIRANALFSNGGLGIDLLGSAGVDQNDPLDADVGPNGLQNFPVITAATSGAATEVSGLLSSAPNTTYGLDFFSSAACDSTGFGEGSTYLGSGTVTTGPSGDAAFTASPLGPTTNGALVTATATDPSGNTSEFSACRAASATSSTSGPIEGKSVHAQALSGTVLVRPPGASGFTQLSGEALLPIGTLIDTRQGKVQLTDDYNGTQQTVVYFDGLFKVAQKSNDDPILRALLRGPLTGCGRRRSHLRRSAALAYASSVGGRHLWGSGHGRFGTSGHRGSATVRATIWLVEDRCTRSTLFKVRRGIVAVDDYGKPGAVNKLITPGRGPRRSTYVAGP